MQSEFFHGQKEKLKHVFSPAPIVSDDVINGEGPTDSTNSSPSPPPHSPGLPKPTSTNCTLNDM